MATHNVEATREARRVVSMKYRRDRLEMKERHAEEARALEAKQEAERAALWRTYCVENMKVVV